jgi:hypothetical protein
MSVVARVVFKCRRFFEAKVFKCLEKRRKLKPWREELGRQALLMRDEERHEG